MGRRKIEIQPITHERNRSVTFLKRKNGLFKKAYELGVLCSVDVAVIIFEDRPGHDLKLHQYSSSDIRDIVQKQVRHQGEKDIKIPGDFSGAGGVKFDEIGDGDDDVVEEEEEAPVRNNKRGGKLSLPADVATTSVCPRPICLNHSTDLSRPSTILHWALKAAVCSQYQTIVSLV
ncbi:hypothetical protein B0H34DRAFT_668312 [Crassisporium funariophilum]|nr:hypothetical protein B0H34DRAFT_669512 [Crassisporium funariophilum]KAF8148690.1 hypothetical protein B0H34DRAFT_668312 [Crassisporium funariophilum]